MFEEKKKKRARRPPEQTPGAPHLAVAADEKTQGFCIMKGC